MRIKFTKMHGLGNDFIVVDLVTQKFSFTTEIIKQLADRHFGIGFDQLLVVEPPTTPNSDFSYRIYNADGSEVEQCGNGVRCFARFVNEKRLTRKQKMSVETNSGIVYPELLENGWVRVNMGQPKFAPSQIPVLVSDDAINYNYQIGQHKVQFSTVNMGNTHAVIHVPSVQHAPVQEIGSLLESHPLFPQRVNVGFMEIISPVEINLRVFERGTGETKACGTGACAAVVAGIRQNKLQAGQDILVHLSGGDLKIKWQPNDVVWMTGPTASVYEGAFNVSSHI